MLQMIKEMVTAWKLKKAMNSRCDVSICVVCDSRNTTIIAPGAYCCNECGHEGGDGYGAYKTSLKHAAYQNYSQSELRASAKKDLIEARGLLQNAVGELKGATVSSAMDMVGLGGFPGAGEGNEKQTAMTSAINYMLEAQALVEDAKAKMALNFNSSLATGENGSDYLSWSADLYFDSLLTDLNFHSKISKAQNEATRLVVVIENVLAEQFGEIV